MDDNKEKNDGEFFDEAEFLNEENDAAGDASAPKEEEKAESLPRAKSFYEDIDILDYDYELTGEAVKSEAGSAGPDNNKKENGAKKKAPAVLACVLVFLALFIVLKFVLNGDGGKEKAEKDPSEVADHTDPTNWGLIKDTPTPSAKATPAGYPVNWDSPLLDSDYPVIRVKSFTHRNVFSNNSSRIFNGFGTLEDAGYVMEGFENFYAFWNGFYDAVEFQYFIDDLLIEKDILKVVYGEFRLDIHRFRIETNVETDVISQTEIESFNEMVYYKNIRTCDLQLPYQDYDRVCYVLTNVDSPEDYLKEYNGNSIDSCFVLFAEGSADANVDTETYEIEPDSIDVTGIVKVKSYQNAETVFENGNNVFYGMGTMGNVGYIEEGEDFFREFLIGETDSIGFEYYIGDFLTEEVRILRENGKYLLDSQTFDYHYAVTRDGNINYANRTVIEHLRCEYDYIVAYKVDPNTTADDDLFYALCNNPIPHFKSLFLITEDQRDFAGYVLLENKAIGFDSSLVSEYHICNVGTEETGYKVHREY